MAAVSRNEKQGRCVDKCCRRSFVFQRTSLSRSIDLHRRTEFSFQFKPGVAVAASRSPFVRIDVISIDHNWTGIVLCLRFHGAHQFSSTGSPGLRRFCTQCVGKMRRFSFFLFFYREWLWRWLMSSRRSNFAWFRLGRFFFVHATSLGFFFENDAAVMATSRRHMASVFVRCSPTAEIKYKFRRNRLIRSRPSSPFLCRPFLYFFFPSFQEKKRTRDRSWDTAHTRRTGRFQREREREKKINR